MASHSSILAWRIPWIEESGGLQSMGFPRQEYWSDLPFPPPGDLPNPGIKHMFPTLAGGFFTTEPPEKLKKKLMVLNYEFPALYQFSDSE